MPSSSVVVDRFERPSGTSAGAVAARGRHWESDVQERAARFAAEVTRLARSSAPALTFIYLVAVWVIFTGVLLAIHPGNDLAARILTGLAGR